MFEAELASGKEGCLEDIPGSVFFVLFLRERALTVFFFATPGAVFLLVLVVFLRAFLRAGDFEGVVSVIAVAFSLFLSAALWTSPVRKSTNYRTMRNYCSFIFIPLIAAACQNAAIESTNAGTSADRIINPVIETRIAEKKQEQPLGRFPNLSDMPKEKPQKMGESKRASFQSDLLKSRDNLLVALSFDTNLSQSDRAFEALLMQDGRMVSLSLEEAAAALSERILQDQERVARQMRQPFPQLGGLPPKDQR